MFQPRLDRTCGRAAKVDYFGVFVFVMDDNTGRTQGIIGRLVADTWFHSISRKASLVLSREAIPLSVLHAREVEETTASLRIEEDEWILRQSNLRRLCTGK